MVEAILIFLAISALQLIAAYSKQKKEEAAKRAAPQPSYEEEEIVDENEEGYEEEEKEPEFVEEPVVEELEFKREGLVPQAPQINFPFESITNKKFETNSHVPILNSQLEEAQQNDFKLNIGSPEQGILWIAILHEPRYRVKWKRK
jgi:hypothetical protein